MRAAIAAALTAAAIAAGLATDADARSKTEVRHFKTEHPCPSTGKAKGSCPGYVVDHRVPLCAGGADHPSNMQWQTTEEGKIKDRTERKQCARPKH